MDRSQTITRRAAFATIGGALASTAALAVPAAVIAADEGRTPLGQVSWHAARAAELMRNLVPGTWVFHVKPELGFILINRAEGSPRGVWMPQELPGFETPDPRVIF